MKKRDEIVSQFPNLYKEIDKVQFEYPNYYYDSKVELIDQNTQHSSTNDDLKQTISFHP